MFALKCSIVNFLAAPMLAHRVLSLPTTTAAQTPVESSVVTSNLPSIPAWLTESVRA